MAKKKNRKLGATGRFPQGKLNKDDEGEIRLAIGHENGKVIIDFGKPVAWIGMNPQEAIEFAAMIFQHVRECR